MGDKRKKKHPFHFEKMWQCDESCTGTVVEAWNFAPGGFGHAKDKERILRCGKALKCWEKLHFSHVNTKLVHLKKSFIGYRGRSSLLSVFQSREGWRVTMEEVM